MLLQGLEIYCENVSPMAARVCARLPGRSSRDGWKLTATLSGPENLLAATLPIAQTLAPAVDNAHAADDALFLAAVLPDPSYWLTDSPARYRVDCELRRHGELVAQESRELGICPVAAQGKNLFIAGKRAVARGAVFSPATINELQSAGDAAELWQTLREERMSIVLNECRAGLLAAASIQGVSVVADLRSFCGADLMERLEEFSRFPATLAALLPAALDSSLAAPLRSLKQVNRVLRVVDAAELAASEVPAWAQAALVAADDASYFSQAIESIVRPIFTQRRAEQPFAAPTAARRACELLQRDLTPYGDFAGYLV